MKKRCNCKSDPIYHNYGGRGISVCDEWSRYPKKFIDWALKNGYSAGLQIDRIDNDGNYDPRNCQFITHGENNAIGKQRRKSNNKSGYVGVSWDKERKKWKAQIYENKKRVCIGRYDKKEDAITARANREIKYLGERKTNLLFKIEDSI